MAAKQNIHSPFFRASLRKRVKLEEQVSSGCEAGRSIGSQAGTLAKDFSPIRTEDIKQEEDEKVELRACLSAVKARGSDCSEMLDNLPPIKLPKQQQPKQKTLERWGFGKEAVTQNILDRKIMDFIVGEALPLQTVDKPLFVHLVLLGIPKGLTVMSAKTLRERIEKRAADIQETLTNQMGAVAFVATVADCWTDGKKKFLGVTAYWISPVTLKHESGVLACKCLKGHLTYSVLAKALHEVYVQYGIQNKIVCTTTDNNSNFVKAFCLSKAREPVDAINSTLDEEEEEEDEDDVQEKAEVEFLSISEILDAVNNVEKEAANLEDFSLPPHHRCVSHTLTLVATQDLEAMILDTTKNSPLDPFRKHFSSLMEKFSKLWSKQKQSTQIAEYIREQCSVYLKVPNKTRWNSTFYALKQLNELLSSMPLRVDAIMNRCSLGRITPVESQVLQEYTDTMEPLAQSLDILEGKNGMFMGYLLPTLSSLDHELERLENKYIKYMYCLPLLRGVRKALRERFAPVWKDKKLILAACLHPYFKLDWFRSAQINRDMMESLLKSEIQNSVTKVDSDGFSENNQEAESLENGFLSFKSGDEKSAMETAVEEVLRDMMEALLKSEIQNTVTEVNRDRLSEYNQEGGGLENGFFSFRSWGKKSEVETADEEVFRYLECLSREVSSLRAFPRIMQSFLRYNTGLPSSAATDHLFSMDETDVSKQILNRRYFSDYLFEQLVLLRQNKDVC